MKIVLIGQKYTKRTEYFLKAAKEQQADVDFIEIFEPVKELLKGTCIKVDPPIYDSYDIEVVERMGRQYQEYLRTLTNLKEVTFLNHPSAIMNTLNKVYCKKVLMENKIPVTSMIGYEIRSYEELRSVMTEKRAFQVFIKPVLGSGAAGVIAYRFQPKTGEEQLYTSMKLEESILMNTKSITCVTKHKAVRELIEQLVREPVIVEKWVPKESYDGKSFDLRVVYQFGRTEEIVARLSKSPITNLHLNNNALEIEPLKLSPSLLDEIEQLCGSAITLFPGLKSAGFDILLTKNERKPRIIEINGQGDLLHKDIYNKNKIYQNQINNMKKIITYF